MCLSWGRGRSLSCFTRPSWVTKATRMCARPLLRPAASSSSGPAASCIAWANGDRLHGVIDVDRLELGVKLERPGALLFKRVRARFFDAAERRLQRQAGGNLVDLDHACFDPFGVEHRFFQITRHDRSG